MEKRALGRGISALIPERELGRGEKVAYVKLGEIKPSSLQPRENFESQALEELAQSIKEKGLIQPLLVRRKGEYYELIAGERRFRAAHLLQLEEVPIIIKEDVGDQDALEISLIENIQRQDLNPIEEARAYQYLLDKFHISQERLSELLGKARTSIANSLRLLKLPLEIQEEMKKGRISFAHGRALLEIEDPQRQRKLAQDIIRQRLSVRELESLVRKKRPAGLRRKASPAKTDTYISVLEEELQHILGTKVRINKRKKRGNISIEFYSPEDLERIMNIVRGGK